MKIINKSAKAVLSVLVIFAVLLSSVSATYQTDSTAFTGKIQVVSEGSSTIDLSGIEIQVYKSTQRPQVIETILEYDEEYAFSVFSDENGNFSFERPSAVFSMTVNIDSLPAGYGLSYHTRLYQESVSSAEFELYKIEGVSLAPVTLGAEPNVIFTNADGAEIYVGYDFAPAYTLDEANDCVILSGSVEMAGGVSMDLSEAVSLDEFDPVSKVEQLHKLGLISEEERLSRLVDLLNGSATGMDCGTWIIDELAEYRESTSFDEAPEVLREKIERALQPNHMETASTMSTNGPLTFSSNNFIIHYESSSINKKVVMQTLSYLETLRNDGINAGFRTPLLQTGETKIHVYLSSDPNPEDSTINGETYPVDINGTKAASYIKIYKFSELTSKVKETIAHEYFHAIQNAYYYPKNWFKEACAVWFAAKYSGSIERAKNHFNDYFSRTETSINDYDNRYGAGVFPMAIYVAYGGSSTIAKIYENLSAYVKEVSLTTLQNCITRAISSYDSSGSFLEAYKKIGAYIAFPGYFYKSTIPSDATSWTNPSLAYKDTVLTRPSQSVTLEPYGCKLFSYQSNSSVTQQLTITVDFGSVKYTNSVRIVLQSSSSTVAIGEDVSTTRYSVVIRDFGNAANNKVSIAPINADVSGTVKATVSVSVP